MSGPDHSRVERRLAAILAADAVGFSRLMGLDEEGTFARLRAILGEIVNPSVAEHRGRIFKTTGDGILAEFPSAVDALKCALVIQSRMSSRKTIELAGTAITFRIGVHQGDIICENGDVFGDGVNVAVRLEGLSEPGGICVSARVQEDAAGRCSADFEDLGEQTLKNIARPVRAYRVRWEGASSSPAQRVAVTTDRPSIAVLPFQNMSGDPDQEYFADGMVEEIITALSRIRWLYVIARNSTFSYKGQAIDIKRVGRELGARYVLEGSVRKGGNRVRITAQLIDVDTTAHLWADRFDGSLEDVFELQDNVASSVAGVIEPTLQAAETSRTSQRSVTDLTSYDLFLRAHAMFLSPARNVPDVLRMLDQVLAKDPDFGPALAWAAVCHFLCDNNCWCEDFDANRKIGTGRGKRALQVAGEDPLILTNGALGLAYFGEDIEAMIGLNERALSLNGNFARAWHVGGVLRMWAGQSDAAIEYVQSSMRLSPRARVGWGLAVLAWSNFHSHRFEEAVGNFRLAIEEDPIPATHLGLTACYAQMGKVDEARLTLERLPVHQRRISSCHLASFRTPEQRELLVKGLTLAQAGKAAISPD
ncbi:adenylate/guanylate cyclase domain-containing protein [Nostoc sp. NIES-2111]